MMKMKNPNIKKEITEEDVVELKLKCGIEIHQQLEGKKLFCNCPTTIRDDKEDYTVKRYLRASAGESGKVDQAALAEQKKQKYFLYDGYYDTTCLVETDEEPPHEMNKDALRASLQISKLFEADIVDQVRVMRKTVVDGSNTSGFQRTSLISSEGKIKLSSEENGNYEIGIEAVCLEEDSAKIVKETTEFKHYNLSRLGIPLIEIATSPDMKTPNQIKEVAEYIGMVLRSLSNVKRGLGTIRQDVNISIAKGLRVEIKGAQDLKMIPTIAKNEMLRQHNLLEIFSVLEDRKAHVDKEIKDLSKLFADSTSKVIRGGLDVEDGSVLALRLHNFAGITGLEIQPGRRYGTELSDYAKMMGVKGLFHSDELPNYGITQEEKDGVYRALGANPETDAFLLIAANKGVAMRAIEAAQTRASNFNLIQEVRMARPDGSSSYMRPMPGASRMYPETDVSAIVIDKDNILVPKLLSEQIKDLVSKFGVAEDIAKKLIRDHIDLELLMKEYSNLKVNSIIDLYYGLSGMIKKKHSIDISLDEMKVYLPIILERLNENLITKDSVTEIVLSLHKGESINYDDYKPLSIDDIKEDLLKLLSDMEGAPMGAIIGKAMAMYKGKIDGKELSKFISQQK